MGNKQLKILLGGLIDIIPLGNSCVASDKITVDGFAVGYMYREEPDFDTDSGWRFFEGSESQEYIDDPQNLAIYDLNTIVNYDKTILPYLEYPINSELERNETGSFSLIK